VSISTVKEKFPNVIFLAEVYSPWEQSLQNVGFDYTYDKNLYDLLTSGNIQSIQNWIVQNSLSYTQHSAHFVSNHDQPRAATNFGSWWRADAAALLTFTLPGMRFHWMWQWDGFSNQLDIHLRREQSEPVVKDAQLFYKIFLNITNSDVFKKGEWVNLTVSGDNSSWRLIAYRWQYNDEKRLCVINFSDQIGSGNVVVSNATPINNNDTIPVTDLLSGTTYWRSANEMRTQGLFVVINSWYAQIFQY